MIQWMQSLYSLKYQFDELEHCCKYVFVWTGFVEGEWYKILLESPISEKFEIYKSIGKHV